jgi:hypothetical protein
VGLANLHGRKVLFFSEEKNQKTFIPWWLALPIAVAIRLGARAAEAIVKSLFCFFFLQKKEESFLTYA